MTPLTIYTIIKDGLIALVLIGICYFLVTAGQNMVKVSDFKELQKDIQANAKTEKDWRDQRDSADETLRSDISKINAPSDKPKPPVWVCAQPKPVATLPGNTTAATGNSAGTGSSNGADRGSDSSAVNRRAQVDAAERQIETWLAECRDMKASYPKPLPLK